MLRRLLPAGLLGATLLLSMTSAACGGDDDGGTTGPSVTGSQAPTGVTPGATITPHKPSPSTGGTAGGPNTALPEPAGRYTIQLTDLPKGQFEPNPTKTYIVSAEQFALLGQFVSGLYAATKVQEWNYVGGWTAEYDPIARLSALLEGGYYLNIETYMFSTPEGAREAYQSFLAHYRRTPGSVEETAAPLGNESAAFSIIQGTVSRSDVANIYHRFLFRRGNLIGIVQTSGAEPFMSIDIARNYAILIDSRALGKLPAEVPTPNATAAR